MLFKDSENAKIAERLIVPVRPGHGTARSMSTFASTAGLATNSLAAFRNTVERVEMQAAVKEGKSWLPVLVEGRVILFIGHPSFRLHPSSLMTPSPLAIHTWRGAFRAQKGPRAFRYKFNKRYLGNKKSEGSKVLQHRPSASSRVHIRYNLQNG